MFIIPKIIGLLLFLSCICMTVVLANEPAAPEKTAEVRFNISEFSVEGNTLLDKSSIERVIYGTLGEKKSVNDVEQARQALERLYRDSGFPTVLVTIPEQEINEGLVQLKVTEGRVDNLSVTGSDYFSLNEIKDDVPALAEGAVPYLPAVQEQLAKINRALPDRFVNPVLRPGKMPGTLNVELKVRDQLPLHGTLDFNNQYSRDTSPLHMSAMLRYDNLWQRTHSFSLQFMTTPNDINQMKVLSGTYLMRFAHSDNLLALYGVKTESNIVTLSEISVVGQGKIGGLRFIVPIHSSDKYSHSLSLGIDYKDFVEGVTLLGQDESKTPINYLNFSLQYSGNMSSETTSTRFGFGPNFGARVLAENTVLCGVYQDGSPAYINEFECKRHGAQPNYFYMKANLERDQQLPKGFMLSAHVDGQLTGIPFLSSEPLVSNEGYSAGGAKTVRGYYESQEIGDDGVRTTFEASSPNLFESNLLSIQRTNAFAFLDAAVLHVSHPLGGQDAYSKLAGSGFGIRSIAIKRMTTELQFAWPLIDSGAVNSRDLRIHFDLDYTF